eukprot:1846950-Prymnesium_polylepis.1
MTEMKRARLDVSAWVQSAHAAGHNALSGACKGRRTAGAACSGWHGGPGTRAAHLGVAAVLEAGQVEELAALIDVGPEAMLELLLDAPQRRRVAEVVEVREHAHHAREAVHLAHVEELERLHLEAEAAVDHEQNEIGHLR